MNPRSVARLLGFIILFMAGIMLVPTAVSLHFGEHDSVIIFLETIAIMAVVSGIALWATRGAEMKVTVKDSFLFVTLTWVLLTFFGAIPLQLSGCMESFAQCYFEIMSGFTTTGAAALQDFDGTSRGILFWRNMTNWLGGMGIVVLFVAVLPALGVKGTALYGAESVGPTKDKLTPKIKGTALILWGIYVGISAIQFVLLLFGGIGWYDAITVTFGTMGAAGFTPRSASIAHYHSPYVEWVCVIFMFLAGANFSLYYRLLKGKFRRVFRDGELRLYFGITLTAIILVTISVCGAGLYGFADGLRAAAFQVVSFITTTGFASTDYNVWPVFAQMVLFTLFFVGGCAGSAGGGLKVVRVGVMMRLFKNAMVKRIHPNSVNVVKLGDDTFSSDTVVAIAGFTGFYLLNVVLGSLILSASGQNITIVLTSVLQALGNVGIGLGGIGTSISFAVYPDWALCVLSFLMLVGRLELFTVYSLFTREFWRR